jgi:hypothetical protein
MIHEELISKLIKLGEKKVYVLFKPKQFKVLEKINNGMILNETEERYLRGSIIHKLNFLFELNLEIYTPKIKTYTTFLKILDNYYVTGMEALKHNGYGWDYTTKIVEIINTKLNGEIDFSEKKLKLIKIRSIKKSNFLFDSSDGLKYATNEQIIKDNSLTKNSVVRKKWINLYSTYGTTFSKYQPKDVI